MVIIGITGMMGSGKSTLAEYLFSDEEKEIVNLDHLLDDIKKYFKKNVEIKLRNTGKVMLSLDKKSSLYKNLIKNL